VKDKAGPPTNYTEKKKNLMFNIQDIPQETNILYHEVWAKYGLRRSQKL